VESIKQGNWHQSTRSLRCHRRSLFAFAKYSATCISFKLHALQWLLLLRFTDTFQTENLMQIKKYINWRKDKGLAYKTKFNFYFGIILMSDQAYYFEIYRSTIREMYIIYKMAKW